jgi:uncharacterized protein (TIGR00251 family)
MLRIEPNAAQGTVIFTVRVQPRAGRNGLAGEMDGALKIRLQAPALEGCANQALIDFLARALKTPKSAVRILSGERSKIKRVEVRGVTPRDVEQLLTQEG